MAQALSKVTKQSIIRLLWPKFSISTPVRSTRSRPHNKYSLLSNVLKIELHTVFRKRELTIHVRYIKNTNLHDKL